MNYSCSMLMGRTVGRIYPTLNGILTGPQSSLLTTTSAAGHNAHCGGRRVCGEQGNGSRPKELAQKMFESAGISGASIAVPINLKLMATLHA